MVKPASPESRTEVNDQDNLWASGVLDLIISEKPEAHLDRGRKIHLGRSWRAWRIYDEWAWTFQAAGHRILSYI